MVLMCNVSSDCDTTQILSLYLKFVQISGFKDLLDSGITYTTIFISFDRANASIYHYSYFQPSTFVGSASSFVFFIPAITANDLRMISIPDLIHYIIVLSYFLSKSQYFPFQCWVLNKWTTGTIFISSFVWHDPWLGIEPGTSRTRSQHSTTRLSRRRYHYSTWLMQLSIHILIMLLGFKWQNYWHVYVYKMVCVVC